MPTHDIRITKILSMHILLRLKFLTVHVVRVEWLPLWTTPTYSNLFSMMSIAVQHFAGAPSIVLFTESQVHPNIIAVTIYVDM